MRRKIVKIMISVTLVLILTVSHMAYAKIGNNTETKNSIVNIDKTQAEINDEINLQIDFSKIEYENCTLKLNSSVSIFTQLEELENIEGIELIQSDSDCIVFSISKENLNISNLDLYFYIPEGMTSEDDIIINAEIINNDDSDSKEEQLKIKIVEADKNNEKNNKETEQWGENRNGEFNFQGEQIRDNIERSVSTDNSSTSHSTVSINTASKSMNTEETYQGSNNAYLTDITVNGYYLTPDFSITNTTYFLTVDSDVTSLEIETTTYDSTETVSIYGDSDLKSGQNKVLITVTAENGNTRTYRIIVTRK